MLQLIIQRGMLVILFFQLALIANATPKETTITCKVYNYTGSAVVLYKVENGVAVNLGFRRPVTMDTCVFSLPIEKEGVYFISRAGGHMAAYNYVIYLKPGDKKSVDLYTGKLSLDFDSCKIKSPNAETVHLQNWTDLFNGVCKLGTNRTKRDVYIVAFNKLVEQAAVLKRTTASSSRYFKQMFEMKMDTDIEYARAASFFHFGERMNAGVDSSAERRRFYEPLAKKQFCTAGLLQSEHGLSLLKYTLGYQLFQKYGEQQQMLAVSFPEKIKMICNDTVRAMFAFDRMQQITNYEQFKTDILPFKKLFATTALNQAYQKKEDDLTVYAKGAPAYNFTLNDVKNQTVSLSDFKGKVVVVDVWAMWCAPCLAEKPIFLKVEEEFKSRDDVAFIGISQDGLSRRGVWEKFVEKKGYKNVELLSNYNESIGEYYKITGIPRFMIFDKEGKIVTVDAPRPSNPEFKKIIEQTLKIEERVTNH